MEIWFRRMGRWRRMPVHWKGFALLLAVIGFVVPSVFAATNLSDRNSLPSGAFYAIAFVGFLAFFAMADRHTAERD
jgi:hypothetical protein